MPSTFSYTDGTAAINTFLTEEANRINPDIRRKTLARSIWVDLVKRGSFPAGSGFQINKAIYARALPKYESSAGSGTYNTIGVKFNSMNSSALAADNSNIASGVIAGSHSDTRGVSFNAARVDFAKELKQTSPEITAIFSPYIDLYNSIFTTDLATQLEQVIGALADTTAWCWERRFRSEYAKKCRNLVVCKAANTAIATTYTNAAAATPSWEGSDVDLLDPDANTNAQTPNARLSNAILDYISARLLRTGRQENPWGMVDGTEVFALACSPEAIKRLREEPGVRDDYRHSEFANDLLRPFGVKQTHRGWALLSDITIPRYNVSGSSPNQTFVEVLSDTFDTDGISVIPNPAYDTAQFEVAYVFAKDVAEFQFLPPNVNAGAAKFDPQNFMGDFSWLNIPDQVSNPRGTNGRFMGVLASATQAYRTDFGYVILFDRTAAALAE